MNNMLPTAPRGAALITDKAPAGFMEAVAAAGFAVTYREHVSREELESTLGQYTAVVVNTGMDLNAEVLRRAAPTLRYLVRPGSGLDNIDLKACAELGIMVFASPEANALAVAEHTLAMLLSLLRHIGPASHALEKEHCMARHENTGRQLNGLCVGLIGHGHTGGATARLLAACGCRVLAFDKYAPVSPAPGIQPASWAEIYREAEVLTLHLPLNSETRHIIGERDIRLFARPPILLNTSRGAIVDTACLPALLDEGKLAAVGLDVIENEKPATWSPVQRQWMENMAARDNVLITPHIAGWTREARRDIFFSAWEKLARHLESLPPAR